MKKVVPFLAAAGGVLGIISNLLFYIFGSITIGLEFTIIQGIIPGLDLSTADADLQNIISINAITSSLLCAASVIAGIFYFRGDKNEEQKNTGKYVSAVVLATATAGLAITFSFFSIILIGIAAVAGLISVRNDFRNELAPESDKLKKSIIISVLLSTAVLIIIYSMPLRYF